MNLMPGSRKPTTRETITALAGSLAEWLFAMLPLVVVAIVLTYLGRLNSVVESPEWAFGAAILSAQSLYRFVGGVARARRISLERMLLGVAVMLVVVVGPTNVILVLVVISEMQNRSLPQGLAVAQAVLFGLASVFFVLIAAAANLWTAERTELLKLDERTERTYRDLVT